MKKIGLFLTMVVLAMCAVFAVGCKSKDLSKEDIAYKIICQVAESRDVDTSDMVLQSGSVEEEDGVYSGWFKIKVGDSMVYYTGTYDKETKEIKGEDTTKLVESSIVGPGPKFLETDSFNIKKVNKKL